MTLPDLQARIRRLDALALGLMRETLAMRQGLDLLLYAERREYVHALRRTIEGIEGARVALAGAVQRLEP